MEARLVSRLARVIRAVHEIEHFNKTRFNMYLQVNTGRGGGGETEQETLLVLEKVFFFLGDYKTERQERSCEICSFIQTSLLPRCLLPARVVVFSFLSRRVLTGGRGIGGNIAARQRLDLFSPQSSRGPAGRRRASPSDVWSYQFWLKWGARRLSLSLPQTHSYVRTHTFKHTAPARMSKGRTMFFFCFFFQFFNPSNPNTKSGLFASDNRH